MVNEKIKRLEVLLDFAYQPIVELKSEQVIGYEAFLRGVENLSFHTPTEFFDRAYLENVLYYCDLELREKAIVKIKDRMKRKGNKLFYKYDCRTLEMDCCYKSKTKALLRKYDIQNDNFCFDFQPNQKKEAAGDLSDWVLLHFILSSRQDGFQFCLDDHQLSLRGGNVPELSARSNYIKIDSRILSLAKDSFQTFEAVSHLLWYARAKRVKTIAMRIETEMEYEMCRELGFEYAQGYYLGKPSVDFRY